MACSLLCSELTKVESLKNMSVSQFSSHSKEHAHIICTVCVIFSLLLQSLTVVMLLSADIVSPSLISTLSCLYRKRGLPPHCVAVDSFCLY